MKSKNAARIIFGLSFLIPLTTFALEGAISVCPKSPQEAVYEFRGSVQFDKKSGKHVYTYTLANSRNSPADIEALHIYFEGTVSEINSPAQWEGEIADTLPIQNSPFVSWNAYGVDPNYPDDGSVPPASSRIRPGQSRTFSFKSPNAPGIQTYAIDVSGDFPRVILPSNAPADFDPEALDPDCPGSYGKPSDILPRGAIIAPALTPSIPMKTLGVVHAKEKKKSRFSVLVYSDERFDSSQLDLTSFKLGPQQTAPLKVFDLGSRLKKDRLDDQDGDEVYTENRAFCQSHSKKRPILLVFDGSQLGLTCGKDRGIFLNAKLKDGKSVRGGDEFKLVGCEKKPSPIRPHRPHGHAKSHGTKGRH